MEEKKSTVAAETMATEKKPKSQKKLPKVGRASPGDKKREMVEDETGCLSFHQGRWPAFH